MAGDSAGGSPVPRPGVGHQRGRDAHVPRYDPARPAQEVERITTAFPLRFEHGVDATGVRVSTDADVAPALRALGLDAPRPVVVLVGGASGLDDHNATRLRPLFADGLIPAAVWHGAVVVDGGTQSGVMRLVGEAHRAAGADTPLVGVAAEGTVALPGSGAHTDADDGEYDTDAAPLQPAHTHFVLVPGHDWGAESPWIARIATGIAAGATPSCTVLADGGEIAYRDAAHSVDAGRRVLAITGSGRTADELTSALRGEDADPRAGALVASGLVRAIPMGDPAALRTAIAEVLGAE